MKKYLFLLPLALIACQSHDVDPLNGSATIHFDVKGFTPIQTRTAIDESDMTDLWLFDFVGDNEVQAVHLTDFASTSLNLTYGAHRVCLVASRGGEPTVDSNAKTIIWATPRDTFWGDVELNVVASSNGTSANVTLNRVATKLRISITDEVPDGISKVLVTPNVWYTGISYETGEAAGEVNAERSINVPSSYVGTSGSLVMNFFGMSDSGEWMTDLLVKATDADGNVLGQATIEDAPFVRNRSTEYSGPLFGSKSGWSITLNDEWATSYTGTW